MTNLKRKTKKKFSPHIHWEDDCTIEIRYFNTREDAEAAKNETSLYSEIYEE